jgi:AcrR family transcriptional regulator
MSLRELKKQQVRERILEVCERLFRSRGFDETTIDEIARESVVSRQTFFNFFAGKDAVLAELGAMWLRSQAELPRAGARTGNPANVFEGAREAIRGQLRAIEGDREFMRLVFTRSGLFFPQGPHVGTPADKTRLDHTRAMLEALAELLSAGQRAGVVRRDIDAHQAAEIYISVLVITIRLWLTSYWGEGETLEERGLRAIRVLEDGLRVQETHS